MVGGFIKELVGSQQRFLSSRFSLCRRERPLLAGKFSVGKGGLHKSPKQKVTTDKTLTHTLVMALNVILYLKDELLDENKLLCLFLLD